MRSRWKHQRLERLLAVSSLVAVLGVVACDSESDQSSDGTDTKDTAGGDTTEPDVDLGQEEPDFDWPPSQFQLDLADWGATFTGSALTAPRPAFHTETAQQGQCRLLEYSAEPCSPACEWGSACLAGECLGQPEVVGLGDLYVVGLGSAPLLINENAAAAYWKQFTEVTLDHAGPQISLLGGSTTDPWMTLSVAPTTPIALNEDWQDQFQNRPSGGDVVLSWAQKDPGARVYLRMTTGIGTHGGVSPVELECEGRDSGSLTLPGAFLDALYAQGWSCGECGGNDLHRYRAAILESPPSPATSGAIQFRVGARTSFWHHPKL